MRIDLFSLFPELFTPLLTRGMVRIAREKSLLRVCLHQLRAFADDRHASVDERPYGGGPGMILRPEPISRALELTLEAGSASRKTDRAGPDADDSESARPVRLLATCPQGRVLDQDFLIELACEPRIALLCGRYEGYDERIFELAPWERVSLGEFVLSGGEIPAMAIVEGIARLIPGVLGDENSAERDSFGAWARAASEARSPESSRDVSRVGLDHPHYTRPESYRGLEVPEVLKSGDHGRIEAWRKRMASIASEKRRD